MTATLMLRHKGLHHRCVHLMVGPHALGLLARGFHDMTVPAMKIDGDRVQGSRSISRALEQLAPQPPLFPADLVRRKAVMDAERWGEELQDAVRRIVLCGARRDPDVFLSLYRHSRPRLRPVQRVSCGLVTRLASAGHGATDRAVQEDVAGLSGRVAQVDAWIDQGLLDGADLNAADFQIAPALSLLLCLDDLAPSIRDRPAARLARRMMPGSLGHVGAVLPDAWLAAAHATAGGSAQSNERVTMN
jgi:glutathione S-transferase